MRVLLYRECDKTGRKLLFDSNALQKVTLKETNGNIGKNGTDRFTRFSEYNTNNRNRNGNTNCGKSQAYKTHSSNSFIEVCEEYGYKVRNSTYMLYIYNDEQYCNTLKALLF